MNGLSLFSGIGGIDVALSEYVRPIAFCEIDPYCQGVLLSRMADESLSNSPIWDDIKTLDGNIFKGAIDIIYGGFPCQDISVAGNGEGLAGKRSGLFFEIMRLAEEIKPKFIFLENVPAITTRGGLQVVREIASLGYDCRWCIISAESVGALHRRERWFLLAYSNGQRCNKEQGWKSCRSKKKVSEFTNSDKICNTNSKPSKQANISSSSICDSKKTRRDNTTKCGAFESRNDWQKIVREMGKCSDGIPNHVDRLRALGNGVVPQQVKKAFEILMGLR